jgi:serine/threonine protein phosphatase PrpC
VRPRPTANAKASIIVLWGDELTELGRRRIEAPKPNVAIGLSAGAKKKAYSYIDPNEDAVAVAITSTRVLLVVADGHNGMASTRAAVGHVLDELGDVPAPSGVPDRVLVDVFHRAGEAVQVAANAAKQPQSRTTLIVAIAEGGELRWAVMGDSLLCVVSPDGEVAFLGERLSRFVGWPMTPAQVDERLGRGLTRLREGSWVIAATDGLSDFVPQLKHRLAAVTAASRRAPAVVEQLIDDALAGGAGDNVAVGAVAISTNVVSHASTAPR